MGLGCVASGAPKVSDEMLLAAADAVAGVAGKALPTATLGAATGCVLLSVDWLALAPHICLSYVLLVSSCACHKAVVCVPQPHA